MSCTCESGVPGVLQVPCQLPSESELNATESDPPAEFTVTVTFPDRRGLPHSSRTSALKATGYPAATWNLGPRDVSKGASEAGVHEPVIRGSRIAEGFPPPEDEVKVMFKCNTRPSENSKVNAPLYVPAA